MVAESIDSPSDPVEPPARRSCLSVPGSSERKLAKAAAGTGADEIVIDLEDAVAASAKDDARIATVAALAAWAGGAVSVRVNAPRSPWCHLDVMALAGMAGSTSVPVSIVVPKVEDVADLEFFDRLLDGAEAASGRRHPLRLQALILGYADLAASLGRAPGARSDLELWRPAQEAVLVAARAHGLQAIDGPYLGVEPDASFVAAAVRARDLGFDGKWAIHPAQVPALNELFTPTAEEVGNALAIVAALEQAERHSGQGAVTLDGQMLDEAIRASALRTLARSPRPGAAR